VVAAVAPVSRPLAQGQRTPPVPVLRAVLEDPVLLQVQVPVRLAPQEAPGLQVPARAEDLRPELAGLVKQVLRNF
jgi:hypothetical protein